MTGGDPYYSTLFLPLLAFREAFGSLRFGMGSAITLITFVASLRWCWRWRSSCGAGRLPMTPKPARRRLAPPGRRPGPACRLAGGGVRFLLPLAWMLSTRCAIPACRRRARWSGCPTAGLEQLPAHLRDLAAGSDYAQLAHGGRWRSPSHRAHRLLGRAGHGAGQPALAAALGGLAIGLLLVPLAALWLPRFVLFNWLHLTNTYRALLAPAAAGLQPAVRAAVLLELPARAGRSVFE